MVAGKHLPEIPARGYANEELESLYTLGRHYLEIGRFYSAKNIFNGLVSVSPEFVKAWQGLTVTCLLSGSINEAAGAARQLLRIDPGSILGHLLLVDTQLIQKDFNSAGTALGEISEMIEKSPAVSPNLIKIFKALLVRFEHKR